jgi:hypothetical protein
VSERKRYDYAEEPERTSYQTTVVYDTHRASEMLSKPELRFGYYVGRNAGKRFSDLLDYLRTAAAECSTSTRTHAGE